MTTYLYSFIFSIINLQDPIYTVTPRFVLHEEGYGAEATGKDEQEQQVSVGQGLGR